MYMAGEVFKEEVLPIYEILTASRDVRNCCLERYE